MDLNLLRFHRNVQICSNFWDDDSFQQCSVLFEFALHCSPPDETFIDLHAFTSSQVQYGTVVVLSVHLTCMLSSASDSLCMQLIWLPSSSRYVSACYAGKRVKVLVFVTSYIFHFLQFPLSCTPACMHQWTHSGQCNVSSPSHDSLPSIQARLNYVQGLLVDTVDL